MLATLQNGRRHYELQVFVCSGSGDICFFQAEDGIRDLTVTGVQTCALPISLKDGKLSPGAEELQQMIAMWGPAAKPGDQARISDIQIKDDRIHFEINGGPVKKQKWYQRIEVGGMGGTTPVAPSDPNANPRGSYVDLVFDHYVPDFKPQQLKDLRRPVFDFDAKSAVEAYLETVPAPVKDAIKNHRVLAGMNREMVIYAKGRAPKKVGA